MTQPASTSGWSRSLGVAVAFSLASVMPALSAEEDDLAKQLSNPIASLISIPVQGNFETNIGPLRKGDRLYFNIQPVIPFSLGEDWNVISRTIVPTTYQNSIFPGAGSQFGLGDTVQSFFFSPKTPGPSGIIWGAGPVFLVPTATDSLLGEGSGELVRPAWF